MDEITSPAAAPATRSRGRAAAASAAREAARAAALAVGGRQGRGYGRGARGAGQGGRGRGRGEKRRREPDLPQPPQDSQSEDTQRGSSQEHNSTRSSSSQRDTDDEEVEQQQQQAVQPPLPQRPQLTVRQQAMQLLMQSTGVPRDRATMALDETQSDPEPTDALFWVDEAQIWLAERAEFEDERERLAETMRVSLEEAEQRKAAQKPLAERTPEDIQQEFAASELLCRLAERRSLASLLAPPLRQPLLDYLVLEAKCRRWYSMSRHYFAAAAQQLVAQLDDESDEGGSVGREPAAVGQQEEPPSKRRRAWQGGSARGKGPISGEQAAVLAVALECAREEVQAAVFAMPAGGDCIEVPQLFAGAVPAEAEEEVVVLDSEEEDERMGGLQQQQQAQQAQQEEAPQQQGSQRERQQEQAG